MKDKKQVFKKMLAELQKKNLEELQRIIDDRCKKECDFIIQNMEDNHVLQNNIEYSENPSFVRNSMSNFSSKPTLHK